jgi:hypothetical protein
MAARDGTQDPLEEGEGFVVPHGFPLGSSNNLKRHREKDYRTVAPMNPIFRELSETEIEDFEKARPPQYETVSTTHDDCLGRFEGARLSIRSDPSLLTNREFNTYASSLYEYSSWKTSHTEGFRIDTRGY